MPINLEATAILPVARIAAPVLVLRIRKVSATVTATGRRNVNSRKI